MTNPDSHNTFHHGRPLKRLAVKAMISTVVVGLCLGLIMSFVEIGLDLLDERKRINTVMLELLEMTIDAAGQAAYELDPLLAGTVIHGLMKKRGVMEARITDDSGKTLAARFRPPIPVVPQWLLTPAFGKSPSTLALLRPEGSSSPVGRLIISPDRQFLAMDFLKRSGIKLATNSLFAILLALAISFLLRLQVTQPLLRMAEMVSSVTPEESGPPLAPPKGHAEDELGLLTSSFNNLLARFTESLNQTKAAQFELKERENRLSSVIENVPYGLFIFGLPSGKILFSNRLAGQMFGLSRDEVLGMRIWDFVESDREKALAEERVLERFQGKSESDAYVYTGKRKNGSTFRCEITVAVVEYQGEHAAQGFLRDITQREMLERQLQHSRKMEAVGSLASGIAHDFNNILQAINGHAQIIKLKKPTGARLEHSLVQMERMVERGSDLVNHLLTFGHRVGVELRPLDLNLEVLANLEILARTIPKMITIKHDLDPEPPLIKSDPGQLGQIFMNLGANARDAMPQGGTLSISTQKVILSERDCQAHPLLTPGPYARISVSDTGAGMDQAIISHIFEPFFTTKGVGKGTGLGLSTVYGIVRHHKGDITCLSAPNGGTTFNILLPISVEGAEPRDTPSGPRLVKQTGGETILLVDDEASVLETSRDILNLHGYEVMTAQSGEEAIAQYRMNTGEIDLIVMDLGMPGMGGQAALGEIMTINPQAKVVVASGYGDSERTEGVLQAGARAFVSKPYRINDLIKAIRSALDG